MQVIPPAPPSDTVTYPPLESDPNFWPPVTIECTDINGDCPQAITWPNNTALPRSQTGYAQNSPNGDGYYVNIIDPTIVVVI